MCLKLTWLPMSHQVAAYWAKQKKSDFTTVVQPFLSAASSDNFTIEFLSMVRAIKWGHVCTVTGGFGELTLL